MNLILLSQLFEGYELAASARHLSPHTLADYRNSFHKLQNFLDLDLPIDQIDRATLQRFFAAQDVSNKTLLNYHTGLSALWTWAVSERLAPENPLRGIQRPKPEKRDIIPLTEQDARALLNAVDHSKTYRRPGKRPTSQLFSQVRPRIKPIKSSIQTWSCLYKAPQPAWQPVLTLSSVVNNLFG